MNTSRRLYVNSGTRNKKGNRVQSSRGQQAQLCSTVIPKVNLLSQGYSQLLQRETMCEYRGTPYAKRGYLVCNKGVPPLAGREKQELLTILMISSISPTASASYKSENTTKSRHKTKGGKTSRGNTSKNQARAILQQKYKINECVSHFFWFGNSVRPDVPLGIV